MTFMWDPFVDFPRFERELRPTRALRRERHFQPAVDVFEVDDAFVVQADVPGVKREELDIQFEEDVLTLSGNRAAPAFDGQTARVSERVQGRFVRKFALPQGVDPERIEASLVDGVLSVRLPKKAQLKARRIEVKEN